MVHLYYTHECHFTLMRAERNNFVIYEVRM